MEDLFLRFAVAAVLGAFVGLEREQDVKRGLGIRTFCLIAVLGCLVAMLGERSGAPWALGLGYLGLAFLLAFGRVVREQVKSQPGMTTEIAALVTFGVGALAYHGPMGLAVALGVGTAALLQYKPQLHYLAHHIGERDLYAIMQFALVAFVVLPVLPNRTFGPLDVLNPHNVWLMVVFVSGISLAAYLALRVVGARYGSLASGLLGGMVSSTAVTVSFAQHAREDLRLSHAATLAVLAATVVTLPRMLIEVAVVDAQLVPAAVGPLGLLFVAAVLPLLLCWRHCQVVATEAVPRVKNPANLRFAVTFGLAYAVVTLAVAAVQQLGTGFGIYLVGALSGIPQVDAITLSTARLISQGRIELGAGLDMMVLGFLANLATKGLIATIVAPPQMWRPLLTGFAAIAVAGILAVVLM